VECYDLLAKKWFVLTRSTDGIAMGLEISGDALISLKNDSILTWEIPIDKERLHHFVLRIQANQG